MLSRTWLLGLCLGMLWQGPSLGQAPPSRFQDWTLVAEDESHCTIQTPAKNDDDATAFVTHPGSTAMPVRVGVRPGYPPPARTKYSLTIGRRSFPAYASRDRLLVESGYENDAIRAMIEGRELILQAAGKLAKRPELRFSLYGFTDAYRASGRYCRLSYVTKLKLPEMALQTVKTIKQPIEQVSSPREVLQDRIPPGGEQTYAMEFAAGPAGVKLQGDGSTDLDLSLQDAAGNTICSSKGFTDRELCEWTSQERETVTVRVSNAGKKPGEFSLTANAVSRP